MVNTASSVADRDFASFEPMLSVSSRDLDEVSDEAGMSDDGGSEQSEDSQDSEDEEVVLPVRRGGKGAGKGLMMPALPSAADRDIAGSSSSSSSSPPLELTQLVAPPPALAPAPASSPPVMSAASLVLATPSSSSAPPAGPLVIAPSAHFQSPEDIFRAFATMTHCQAQFQTQFLTYTGHFQRNMLDMQAQQATLQTQQAKLQTEQRTLQEKQEVMQQSIEKMERTMQEMREENSAVKNNRELRLLLEFIVQYGMDSVRGIVTAFPFVVEGALCLVVNVPLLFGAMKAFIPHQLTAASAASKAKKSKSPGWTRRDVLVQLLKLEFLDYKKCHNKNELFDMFEAVFGVEERHAKRNNLDNYVVLLADKFFYAYRTCKENHTFLKPWSERDVVAQRFKGGLNKVISEDAAEWKPDDDPALDRKMAWGHEVQKEVLCSKAVRLFYKRMYELAGAEQGAGSSSSSNNHAEAAAMEDKWKRPFHFMGLKPVFRKVRTRSYLYQGRERGEEDDDSASASSGGEEEDEGQGGSGREEGDEGSSSGGEEESSSDGSDVSGGPVANFSHPGFGANKRPRIPLETVARLQAQKQAEGGGPSKKMRKSNK